MCGVCVCGNLLVEIWWFQIETFSSNKWFTVWGRLTTFQNIACWRIKFKEFENKIMSLISQKWKSCYLIFMVLVIFVKGCFVWVCSMSTSTDSLGVAKMKTLFFDFCYCCETYIPWAFNQSLNELFERNFNALSEFIGACSVCTCVLCLVYMFWM